MARTRVTPIASAVCAALLAVAAGCADRPDDDAASAQDAAGVSDGVAADGVADAVAGGGGDAGGGVSDAGGVKDAARGLPDGKGPPPDGKGPPPDGKGPPPDGKGPPPDGMGPPPDGKGPPDGANQGPPDNYACTIDKAGYCIFTGTPHALDPSKTKEGFEQVVDKSGNKVKVGGKPFQDGHVLAATTAQVTDKNELNYVKVFKVIAPVRDALMYDIATVDEAAWLKLTKVLTDNQIKLKSSGLSSPNPQEQIYGTADIFKLAKDPKGKDIHHPVMRYLEEAELALKCLWLTVDLTDPKGHDPCK